MTVYCYGGKHDDGRRTYTRNIRGEKNKLLDAFRNTIPLKLFKTKNDNNLKTTLVSVHVLLV